MPTGDDAQRLIAACVETNQISAADPVVVAVLLWNLQPFTEIKHVHVEPSVWPLPHPRGSVLAVNGSERGRDLSSGWSLSHDSMQGRRT